MTRRTFVHPTEKRSWSIEVAGKRVRLGMRELDDPEETVRERTYRSPKEASAEAEVMIREQCAEGFDEVGALPEVAAPSLDALAARWRSADPSAPSAEWLEATRRWTGAFRDRVSGEISALERAGRDGEQAIRDADLSLRSEMPDVNPALLLALRDPRARVRDHVLWVLRSKTRTWDGLPRAPEPHHLAIETAFLSLLAHPETPPLEIANVGVGDVLFSERGIDALTSFALAADASCAVRAAYALACRLDSHRDRALEALARFADREDLPDADARVVFRRIIAALAATAPAEKDPRLAARALIARALRDRPR
jgi:hypothetical protein